MPIPDDEAVGAVPPDRRATVLDSALLTFARHGYRRTSMEEVARTARISRPGLYFLFASKEALFRAAVTQALERDLATVERVLAQRERPLPDRLLEAFDVWTGRYVGPLAQDVPAVVEDNPDLLGDLVATAPARFAALVTQALADGSGPDLAARVCATLVSTSIGLKHQVVTREDYRARFAVALDLVLP